MPQTLYSANPLLFLNKTSLNSDNALLALYWHFINPQFGCIFLLVKILMLMAYGHSLKILIHFSDSLLQNNDGTLFFFLICHMLEKVFISMYFQSYYFAFVNFRQFIFRLQVWTFHYNYCKHRELQRRESLLSWLMSISSLSLIIYK